MEVTGYDYDYGYEYEYKYVLGMALCGFRDCSQEGAGSERG